jgi:hypothetical protein
MRAASKGGKTSTVDAFAFQTFRSSFTTENAIVTRPSQAEAWRKLGITAVSSVLASMWMARALT